MPELTCTLHASCTSQDNVKLHVCQSQAEQQDDPNGFEEDGYDFDVPEPSGPTPDAAEPEPKPIASCKEGSLVPCKESHFNTRRSSGLL